jgi:hypothetical protein
MKEWQKKEYTLSIFTIYLDDDGVPRVSNVKRNYGFTSIVSADTWIEVYKQAINDMADLEHSYERASKFERLFLLRIGADMKVFFLHETSNFDLKGNPPQAVFLEYGFSSAYPSHEVSLEEILEAVEEHLVDEAARESIDDHEASLFQ